MLTDVLEITTSDLQSAYDFAIKTNGNIIIFGPAGCGKTLMAFQAVTKNKLQYRYLNLSVIESVDLIGLPKIENNSTTYATPEFLPILDKETKPIVLILDEIDKAAQELQGPLLELFQFKSINGKKLNIKAIIATGNLPDERAFSKKISHALTNRCLVYKVKHEFDTWRKWALSNNINSLIVGFLERNQHLLLSTEKKEDPTAYCNPSPRAWTLAANDLDSCSFEQFKKTNGSDVNEFINYQFKIIAGRVGFSAAFQFKNWLKYYRDLEPEIIALVEEGITPNKLSSDKMMIFSVAVLSMTRNVIQNAKTSEEKLKYANRVFDWMKKSVPPEFCLSAMKCTINNSFVENHNLIMCEPLNEIFDTINELIS